MTLQVITRSALSVGPLALIAMIGIAGCGASSGSTDTVHHGSGGAHSATGSSANTASAGRGSNNPCTILSGAAVRTAFGGTVSTGSTHNPDLVLGRSCTYHLTGSSLGKEAAAYVVLPGESVAQVELVKKYPDPNAKIVSGVGQFAKYVSYANTLTLVADGKVIEVAATEVDYQGKASSPPKPAHFEASLIALAKTVASRA